MKIRHNIFLAIILLFVMSASVYAEDMPRLIQLPGDAANKTLSPDEPLVTACMTYGAHQLCFRYPACCALTDEGKIGTFIALNDDEYIVLCFSQNGLNGTEQLRDYIGSAEHITVLSDSMHIFSVHGDDNHRMPWLDIVETGINLPDGAGLVATAFCRYGQTEVYDLLLTVLHSVTDTALMEDWLVQTWLPTVTH